FMPPLVSHAELVDLLHFLIGLFVRRRRLGPVFSESIELWLPESQAARLPDIVFIANQHLKHLTSYRLEGYADLVGAVISTGSVTRDRRRRFVEYPTPGIPEYWIVDPPPRLQTLTLYQLAATGTSQAVP